MPLDSISLLLRPFLTLTERWRLQYCPIYKIDLCTTLSIDSVQHKLFLRDTRSIALLHEYQLLKVLMKQWNHLVITLMAYLYYTHIVEPFEAMHIHTHNFLNCIVFTLNINRSYIDAYTQILLHTQAYTHSAFSTTYEELTVFLSHPKSCIKGYTIFILLSVWEAHTVIKLILN